MSDELIRMGFTRRQWDRIASRMHTPNYIDNHIKKTIESVMRGDEGI